MMKTKKPLIIEKEENDIMVLLKFMEEKNIIFLMQKNEEILLDSKKCKSSDLKEELDEDKIEVTYLFGKNKYSLIVNKYIYVRELFDLIKKENQEVKKDAENSRIILVFCGQEMDYKLRLLHYNIDLLKEEVIFIGQEDEYGYRTKIK